MHRNYWQTKGSITFRSHAQRTYVRYCKEEPWGGFHRFFYLLLIVCLTVHLFVVASCLLYVVQVSNNKMSQKLSFAGFSFFYWQSREYATSIGSLQYLNWHLC